MVTVPSAVWLWQQGPKKGAGHAQGGHEEHDGSHKDGEEEFNPSDEGGAQSGGEPESAEADKGEGEGTASGDGEAKDGHTGEDDPNGAETDGSINDEADGKDAPRPSEEDEDEDSPNKIAKEKSPSMKSPDRGPGEQQKGPGKRTEKQEEKDVSLGNLPTPFHSLHPSSHRLTFSQAASDQAGAKNPLLDADEKSKKGEGVFETAKIHGTVQSDREVR